MRTNVLVLVLSEYVLTSLFFGLTKRERKRKDRLGKYHRQREKKKENDR